MPLPVTYGELSDRPSLREGEISFTFPETVIFSGYNNDSVALRPGLGISFHSSASGVGEASPLVLPTTGAVVRGVLINPGTIEPTNGVIQFPVKPSSSDSRIPLIPFLVKGVVGVRLAENVTKGQSASCVFAAGATRGQWGTSVMTVSSNPTATVVANTEYLNSGVVGDIVDLWFK